MNVCRRSSNTLVIGEIEGAGDAKMNAGAYRTGNICIDFPLWRAVGQWEDNL